MPDEVVTTPISAPVQEPINKRVDADVWADILKLQLDGVMMHVALFEEFAINEICGFKCMHKHHSEEEFNNYLHVLGDYISVYKKIPNMQKVIQPEVKLTGETEEEKISKGMELYADWEKKVCEHLRKYKSELTDGDWYVEELIQKVHEEMKNINLMMNDIYDGKYDELNKWLMKKNGGD